MFIRVLRCALVDRKVFVSKSDKEKYFSSTEDIRHEAVACGFGVVHGDEIAADVYEHVDST